MRFTSVEYIKSADGQPQRFLYETRIGFGLAIRGFGETVGESIRETGQRTSKFSFWSNDSRSLIERGSGYWRYVPTSDGVLFSTYYDYATLGKAIDVIFRPPIGWATARSFDCLTLPHTVSHLERDS